jgi:hypothetical protein
MNRRRYTNRRHQVQRLTLWDALAILALSAALWYGVWVFVGVVTELLHFLENN